MICGYGCERKAKYPPSKGKTKWSCESSWQKCPEKVKNISERNKGRVKTKKEIESIRKSKKGKTWEEIYGEEQAKERRKNIIKRQKGKTWEERLGNSKSKKAKKKLSNKHKNKVISKKQKEIISVFMKKRKITKETIKKSKISHKRDINKLKEKYPFFSKIEELRYNPNKPEEKEIQVHCKNHNCPNSKEQGGWFTPTGRQIEIRIKAIENQVKFEQNYFYCSEECKEQCPLFNLKSDPLSSGVTKLYTQQEYQLWRQKVLERENSLCEYCGEEATCAHHEKPVKTHPHLALDPDNGIACCEECHYKYGHKTGTECSTRNLANKICL